MALDVGAGAREKEPAAGPTHVGEGEQERVSTLYMLPTEAESAAAPVLGLENMARFESEVAAVTEEGRASVRCPVPVVAMRPPPLLL